MAAIIQIRRGTAAEWTSANTTLANAEIGYETDTGKMKFGDAVTAWNSLGYFPTGATWGAITGTLSAQTDLQTELDKAVWLDGSKTMTGTLLIGDGSSGRSIIIKESGGDQSIRLRNAADINTTTFFEDNVADEFSIIKQDPVTSADVTTLTLDLLGNVSLEYSGSPAVPTADAHLTRKDYVDGLVGGVTDHDDLTNNGGAGSHATITSHMGDGTIHFTEASIDHDNILNNGVYDHGDLDTHYEDTTIHFIKSSILINDLGDVVTDGSPTLVTDDVLVYNGANWVNIPKSTVGVTDHDDLTNNGGAGSHATITSHMGDGTIHFTEASIDHTAIANVGSNTHADIDAHIATGGSPGNDIHFTQDEINIYESQIIDLQDYALASDVIIENGFTNRTDSTISFDGSPRTFTITPVGSPAQFEYWSSGVKYTVSTSKDVSITNEQGIHAIYFNGATLVSEFAPSSADFESLIVPEYAFVAFIYWDVVSAQAVLVGEERHGRVMDAGTHLYLHRTVGTAYQSGLAMADMTVDGDGSLDAHAEAGYAAGIIWDEDIKLELTGVGGGSNIPILYMLGAGAAWTKEDSVFVVLNTGSGRAAYNLDTAGTWSKAEVDNNNYTLTHYFATGEIDNPVIAIMGQSQYGNVSDARLGALSEITQLVVSDLVALTPEFIAIATVIVQTTGTYTNTPQTRVRSTDTGDDYVDWRDQVALSAGGSAATDHNTLSGLQGGSVSERYHLTAAELALVPTALQDITGEPIDDLSDVVLGGSPILHNALVYDGSNWVNDIGVQQWMSLNNGDALTTLPSATHVGSIAIGEGSSSTQGNAIAIGKGASATSLNNMAMGYNSYANGTATIALGVTSEATAGNAIAIGNTAKATDGYCISIGSSSKSYATSSIAIGNGAEALADWGIAIGQNAYTATGTSAFALGNGADATGDYATAIGAFAAASELNATAIGSSSIASAQNALAIGKGSTASAQGALAIGVEINNSFAYSTSLGYGKAGVNYSELRVHTGGYVNLAGANAQFVAPNYITTGLPTGNTGGLVYDTTTNELKVYDGGWSAVGPAGAGATELNELNDVNLTGSPALATDDVLIYNGTMWVNSAPPWSTELNELTDVNTSTPTNRFVLVADGVDFESRLLTELDVSDLGTYMETLSNDSSPVLGGDLTVNSNAIISTSNGDIEITPDGTGQTVITSLKAPMDLVNDTGTTYAPVLDDADRMITLSDASPITVTIPAETAVDYPIGTKLNFMQIGAGAVTIEVTDDTLNVNANLTLVLNGQWAVATATKTASATWVLFGNLVAV